MTTIHFHAMRIETISGSSLVASGTNIQIGRKDVRVENEGIGEVDAAGSEVRGGAALVIGPGAATDRKRGRTGRSAPKEG